MIMRLAGGYAVGIIWVLIGLCALVFVFLFLWLRERRRAQIEYIAYGLREGEEGDENTKTNLTKMEAEFVAAIARLEELGQIRQDDWGNWVWSDSGEPVGEKPGKD
jgi:hypothetical protein